MLCAIGRHSHGSRLGRSASRLGLSSCRVLSTQIFPADINPHLLRAEYAVRGEIVMRAAELKSELAAAPGSLPFDKVLECNIGNPQAVGQKPISFPRQVLSLIVCPALLEQPGVETLFQADAIAR